MTDNSRASSSHRHLRVLTRGPFFLSFFLLSSGYLFSRSCRHIVFPPSAIVAPPTIRQFLIFSGKMNGAGLPDLRTRRFSICRTAHVNRRIFRSFFRDHYERRLHRPLCSFFSDSETIWEVIKGTRLIIIVLFHVYKALQVSTLIACDDFRVSNNIS